MQVIIANLPYMMRGLLVTLELAVAGLAGSLLLGILLAALRLYAWRGVRMVVGAGVDLMRMVPLIMVMFWIFFLIPILTGQPIDPLLAASVALIVFNASYMAEIVRAGILAVPRGLAEAARASGLGVSTMFLHVVLPLACKSMLPAMVNRFVTLFMATTLAYTIGVTEFFRTATQVNARVFQPFEILGFVALTYFVFCSALSLLGRWLAVRLGRADRVEAGTFI